MKLRYRMYMSFLLVSGFLSVLSACDRNREVSDFQTIHKNMQLTSLSDPSYSISINQFLENDTSFFDNTLFLRPSMGDIGLSVEFHGYPSAQHEIVFQELDSNLMENSFIVIDTQGVVELITKYGYIQSTDLPIGSLQALKTLLPQGDVLVEVKAIRYEISWNDFVLTGEAYIGRSIHNEPDLFD